jgi:hypothetical protein
LRRATGLLGREEEGSMDMPFTVEKVEHIGVVEYWFADPDGNEIELLIT